jgi:putative sterol carrier protein
MSTSESDPRQRQRGAAKRGLGRAPAQLAGSAVRAVKALPDERLAQLMRGPARKLLLDAIFWQMPKQLDRERAAGVRSSVRWRITGRPNGGVDTYQLEVADGEAHVIRGEDGPDPRVTITVDGAEFLRLIIGSSNPISAYFYGRISVKGDVMVAAKLAALFLLPASAEQTAEPSTQPA